MTLPAPVSAVPTPEEVRAAELATLDTWLEYILADKADQDDRWADYQCAIERHNSLRLQREQAALKELSS